MRKCSYCGTEYSDEIEVCERDQTPLAPLPEPQAGKPLTVVMAIVGVVGLLIGGRYLYEYQVIRPKMLEAQEIGCRGNLRRIELEKGLWQVEEKKSELDTPTEGDLFGPERGRGSPPKCPGGGVYRMGSLRDSPTCSVHSRLMN